jgi:hypothetical protein
MPQTARYQESERPAGRYSRKARVEVKESRASAALSPRELVRAALRRAWPGSPTNVPYLARPASRATHGLLNNYEVRKSHAEIWTASRHCPSSRGSRRRRVSVDMKRSGGTGTNIDWTAGGPEAEAALNRCLRLASAREEGVRDEELTRVLRELMGGAMLPEEAWERLARLLDLFGVIGALLAMRLAETFDSDPLDELKDLEDVLRAEIGLD